MLETSTEWKVSKYGVIFGPYFPVFGLNTEIYEVNLRIQSECKKIRTKNNSVFGHFSRSVYRFKTNLGIGQECGATPAELTISSRGTWELMDNST